MLTGLSASNPRKGIETGYSNHPLILAEKSECI